MSTDLLSQLKALHLHGMADAWSEIQAESSATQSSPEEVLRRLLQSETTDRQARSLRYQLNAAKFPIHRDLVSFDWSETPVAQPRSSNWPARDLWRMRIT